MKKLNRQNIFIIVAILILIVTGYIWYRYLQSRPSELVSRGGEENIVPEARELLVLLKTLEKVEIDTAFFEDRVYKSLLDLTPDISVPAIKGRTNPFAPL